jgi:hypothetical protein
MCSGETLKCSQLTIRLQSEPAQTAAIEEAARPSAGCHGGVLAQSQNHQFCLGIICVGCRFRLFHVLSGDELTSDVRGWVGHAAENIVCTAAG